MKKRAFGIMIMVTALVGILLAAGQFAQAFSSGVVGYSGNPNSANGGQTCNSCHSGGVTPTVLIAGPAIVAPGMPATYTLVISGGQKVAGGFNVSTISGTLATLPGATDVQLAAGELTHTSAKAVNGSGQVAFSFRWTAPVTPGVNMLYGAGNSVNGMDGTQGDRAATAVRLIAVGALTDTTYLPLIIRGQ